MKAIQHIGRAAAMFTLAFAPLLGGCSKTEPGPPGNAIIDVVSLKPSSIITTKNGEEISREIYQYRLGALTHYIRLLPGETDSMVLLGDSVQYRRIFASHSTREMLLLNNNKTFQRYRTGSLAGTEFVFQNRIFELNRVLIERPDSGPELMMLFEYSDQRILSYTLYNSNTTISYYDDLPYQKGINELPVANTALLIHKILEQENATSMRLYDKLFRETEMQSGPFGKRTTYSYEFDEHQRVKTIHMDIVRREGTTTFSSRETKTIEYADSNS
jgi:hypothetical protein